MILVRTYILVCVLAIAATAQQGGSTRTLQGFQISGTVVNALGGQPLPAIEVLIMPADGRVPLQMVTASDGHFLFSGLTRGKYGLYARGRGFPGQAYEEHEYFSTAIAVGPGLESENLVFRLRPDSRISGMITDEAGEPVRNAQVWLFKSELLDGIQAVHMRGQTIADEEGHYSFRHLPEGTYFLVISATPWYALNPSWGFRDGGPSPGVKHGTTPQERELDVTYPPTYYPGVTASDEASAITLRPGDRFIADLQLRVVPAYELQIRYAEGDHERLMRVAQRAFDFTFPTMSGIATNANMSMVSGLPPGHYILHFTSQRDANNSREAELDITGDIEVDASSLDAPASVSISGRVQPTGSASLHRDAFLQFVNRENHDEFTAQISPNGEFALQYGLTKPGDYEVEVGNAPEFMVYSVTGTGARVAGHTLHLAGSASVRLNVVLSNGNTRIDGVVLRGKKPISTALVLLVPQDLEHSLSLVRRDQSDSDGTFTLARVIPGNYTVVAMQDGWNLKWADPNVLKPYLERGTPITITTARDYHVVVQAQ